MKPTLFLASALLLAPRLVLGQEVLAPVANTPARATVDLDQPLLDKTLQVSKALEELSRTLGAKESASTKALGEATRRLVTARSLMMAPPTFSLGQGPRQARLVLDSLVAARAWVETARKDAPAMLNTRFDDVMTMLVQAEQEAAKRVEAQEQPVIDFDELLKEGKEFLESTEGIAQRSEQILAEYRSRREAEQKVFDRSEEISRRVERDNKTFVPYKPMSEEEINREVAEKIRNIKKARKLSPFKLREFEASKKVSDSDTEISTLR